jgi:Outer membrane lipoprotein carrier protein LolA-like
MLKNDFRFCLLVLLGILATPLPVAAAPDDFDRVMNALAQRKHGHVTFVERKYIAMLDRPVESSGELLYDAPDHLEKRTVKPKPETLVLDSGVITVQRGHRKYVLELQQYPQIVPFIESIRATLAGDRTALERLFKLDFGGDFEHWTLGLGPLDPKLTVSVRQIRIAGTADLVNSVEIMEADGDRSVLTIGAEAGQ